ncbi:LiaI-LiaF-like domain-containing protein [Anoxybacteroides amylolyticum]|uniref:Putative membrane protein n=1 Tax=Anoxybacteroides amylolyticum TaxID=294699 RepID=A0A160F654_9BACL|nr:DUF5668 domain-containing protein [Anoxybacillus amylolyticus]ANB61562.1 putative membrane protein [Anoxybacillus amylolyticus]
MKKNGMFSGIVLIGLGLYFFAGQFSLPFFKFFQGWPALFIIFGAALLAQAYSAREYQHLFSGTLLFGFGLQFILVQLWRGWPNEIGVFFLIVALAFLLSARKMKTGLMQSVLFFALSFVILFSERFAHVFHIIETSISFIWKFWPLAFILFGVYILWTKKK